MFIGEVWQMLGEVFIIGGMVNIFEDVKLYYVVGVDYLGIGFFWFIIIKKNLSLVLGFEGYIFILVQMNEVGIWILVVVIGGIVVEDILVIMEMGVNGIVFFGVIL